MSSADSLRMIPLGGLGEVGMNCMALEHDGQLLVIDCGTSFPSEDHGVDVVHPDLSWLFRNWARVVGVFLTHGHEDHIGALPYLLKGRTAPIYGPRHALKLVQRRFTEHGLDISGELHVVECGTRTALGPFVVEPIRVSHSIVEATALAISCAAGTVVHSGDFKFDERPSDGEPTDETRLLELGEAGVDLLLSDSTNVDSSGVSASEADVADSLDAIVRDAPKRVFVALFASNVQRLISLGNIAQRRGRRICLLGRSLSVHGEVASELGHLRWPPELLLPPDRA
jgi:ribonuclease J